MKYVWVFLSAFVWTNIQNVNALEECTPVEVTPELIEQSPAIFEGHVMTLSEGVVLPEGQDIIEISQLWKGESEISQLILMHDEQPLKVGQKYLVFAQKLSDEVYEPIACGSVFEVNELSTPIFEKLELYFDWGSGD